MNSYRPAFPGRSIFAEGADRAHRSFRSLANIGVLRAGRAQPLYLLTPSGRFATFGGKCPGCSIIRASLTVALMVSLPRFGSLWAFGPSAHRAHASLRATGHTLPSGAPSGRFAAFGGNSPQGWRFPPVPGGRGVCAPGRKHFLSFWRKRPPQADFFDKLRAGMYEAFLLFLIKISCLSAAWQETADTDALEMENPGFVFRRVKDIYDYFKQM